MALKAASGSDDPSKSNEQLSSAAFLRGKFRLVSAGTYAGFLKGPEGMDLANLLEYGHSEKSVTGVNWHIQRVRFSAFGKKNFTLCADPSRSQRPSDSGKHKGFVSDVLQPLGSLQGVESKKSALIVTITLRCGGGGDISMWAKSVEDEVNYRSVLRIGLRRSFNNSVKNYLRHEKKGWEPIEIKYETYDAAISS